MTWYQTFLWLHVTAAVIWVGGGFMLQVFALFALRSKEPGRTAAFAAEAEWVGMRVFTPMTVLLLAMGIGLVLNGNWDWSEPFVWMGLVILVASAAVGAGFFGPEAGRISKIVAAEGPSSPDALARIRRLLLLSRIELAFLFLALFLMVVKPGT